MRGRIALNSGADEPLILAKLDRHGAVVRQSDVAASLVRTEAEAHHVAGEGRVFTVAEIATLIASLGGAVLEAKKQFPGAAVTATRRKPAADWARGDDVPF